VPVYIRHNCVALGYSAFPDMCIMSVMSPKAKMLLAFARLGSFNVGQSHAIRPSICIAIRAFKTWLKLKVELVLISTHSKACLE